MTAVAELTGANLALWVGRAASADFGPDCHQGEYIIIGGHSGTPPQVYAPHEDWAQGGPLIEKYRITIATHLPDAGDAWRALLGRNMLTGPAPLIAAMRALVTSVYGDTVSDGGGALTFNSFPNVREASILCICGGPYRNVGVPVLPVPFKNGNTGLHCQDEKAFAACQGDYLDEFTNAWNMRSLGQSKRLVRDVIASSRRFVIFFHILKRDCVRHEVSPSYKRDILA